MTARVGGLSLREVSYKPEGTLILRDVSLSVAAGQFVGIVGPNGAGKSTLLRIIAAVLPASKGWVFLDGKEIGDLSSQKRARCLAYVPQRTAVSFPLRVREVVLLGRTPYLKRWQKETEEDFRIAEEAMALTDVTHLAGRDVTTLSGGEMQRVALARALAQRPSFLLLDEPTASLDLRHQLEVMDVLTRLSHRGVTILTALHDLNLASAFCSEVVLLKEGEIYALGSPKDVLTPQNLRAVFEVEVVLGFNPLTATPYVIPLRRLGAVS